MTSTKKKTGRHTKPHVTTYDGTTIDGLYKCPDGRWRITATGQKFTEPDERLAVARFRQWEGRSPHRKVTFVEPISADQWKTVTTADLSTTEGAFHVMDALRPRKRFGAADGADNSPAGVLTDIPEDILFGWLREQLFSRPKYLAERLGIEQIGQPARQPSFAVTIHKGQGSEKPVVVVPFHTQHYTMLQRNLLYTALTGGKKLVVPVGTGKAVAMAVKRTESQKRITTLR